MTNNLVIALRQASTFSKGDLKSRIPLLEAVADDLMSRFDSMPLQSPWDVNCLDTGICQESHSISADKESDPLISGAYVRTENLESIRGLFHRGNMILEDEIPDVRGEMCQPGTIFLWGLAKDEKWVRVDLRFVRDPNTRYDTAQSAEIERMSLMDLIFSRNTFGPEGMVATDILHRIWRDLRSDVEAWRKEQQRLLEEIHQLESTLAFVDQVAFSPRS